MSLQHKRERLPKAPLLGRDQSGLRGPFLSLFPRGEVDSEAEDSSAQG